jgi:hypothetical protein
MRSRTCCWHPSVAEAAAYPVPDEKYGEQVGVVVVLRGDATTRDLAAHVRSGWPSSGPHVSRSCLRSRRDRRARSNAATSPAGGAMKIAVVGAGAIGAYVGAASTERRGRPPHRARKHLQAMRDNGSRPESARRLSRPSARHRRPNPIGPVDIVFSASRRTATPTPDRSFLTPRFAHRCGGGAERHPWWYFHGMPGRYEGAGWRGIRTARCLP